MCLYKLKRKHFYFYMKIRDLDLGHIQGGDHAE